VRKIGRPSPGLMARPGKSIAKQSEDRAGEKDTNSGDHTSFLAEYLMHHVLNQAHARVAIMVPDNFSVLGIISRVRSTISWSISLPVAETSHLLPRLPVHARPFQVPPTRPRIVETARPAHRKYMHVLACPVQFLLRVFPMPLTISLPKRHPCYCLTGMTLKCFLYPTRL